MGDGDGDVLRAAMESVDLASLSDDVRLYGGELL